MYLPVLCDNRQRGCVPACRLAFTLLEMLIAAAVVGILIAMTVPFVGRVRESAHSTQCINNLRQISAGISLYVQDHGGMLPAQSSAGNWSNQSSTWGYAIWPYVYGDLEGFRFPENDLQISMTGRSLDNAFSCPSAVRGVWVAVSGATVSNSRFSYGLNNGAYAMAWIAPAMITTPSQTALVVESSTPRGDYYSFFNNGTVPHSGKMNVLFFDGHVDAIGRADIPRKASDVFWTVREG